MDKFFDKLDKIFKFYSNNIRIKMVSDVDFGFYSIAIFFSDDGRLSVGQYEMLTNWCEESGYLIKNILANIDFEYDEEKDSLIYCEIVGKEFYMNGFRDVIKLFKRGIDYDKVSLQKKSNHWKGLWEKKG